MRTFTLLVASFLAATVPTFLSAQNGQGAGRGAPAHGPNAILGRVTDGSGHSVPDVFVTALRPNASSPKKFQFVSALLHTRTDTDGQFRLDGLALGDYYVVALPHNGAGSGVLANRSGFRMTFFPNAIDVAGAQTVHVTGTSPAQADVTLAPGRLAVISGIVIGSNGQAVAGGKLEIAHGNGLFGLDSGAFPLRSNGTFALAGVPPGEYFLVLHESAWPPARGTIPTISQVKVVVGDSDVTAVRVMPIHMVPAAGRVIADGTPLTTADLSSMTVGASPIDFDGNPGPSQAGVLKPDMTFDFKTWPSVGRVRVLPEAVWVIKAVRLNGVDVTNGIGFAEGKEVTGLEVEISRRQPGRGARPRVERSLAPASRILGVEPLDNLRR